MTLEQRAEARAYGAIANLISGMMAALEREGRSPEYCVAFWGNLQNVAADYARDGFVREPL